VDDLLQRCRDAESMDFSRRRKDGLGIVAYNAALNTFCELGCGFASCQIGSSRSSNSPDVACKGAVV
jgi:hypothetical protein